MMNREEIGEESSGITFPDPVDEFLPWQGRKSDCIDVSPVSSRYSSCGESDFERYCSATSAMGTPSICSSVGAFQECVDSEFGSVKSFVLDGGAANFSSGGRFDRKIEDKRLSSTIRSNSCAMTDSSDRNDNAELGNSLESRKVQVSVKNDSNLYGAAESYSHHEFCDHDNGNVMLANVGSRPEFLMDLDLGTALDFAICDEDNGGYLLAGREHVKLGVVGHPFENEPTQEKEMAEAVKNDMTTLVVGSGSYVSTVEEANSASRSIGKSKRLLSPSAVDFDEREPEICSDEGETSSRYGHSEGEDSVFGYGTDNEQLANSCCKIQNQFSLKLSDEKQNPLLMNSSTAYGSDDWDDFMLETGEVNLTSTDLGEFQGPRHLWDRGHVTCTSRVAVDSSSICVPGQQKTVRNIPSADNLIEGADELSGQAKTCYENHTDILNFGEAEERYRGNSLLIGYPVKGKHKFTEYLESCSVSNVYESEIDSLGERVSSRNGSRGVVSLLEGLNNCDYKQDTEEQFRTNQEVSGIEDGHLSESHELEKKKLQPDPSSVGKTSQLHLVPVEASEGRSIEFLQDHKSHTQPSLYENNINRVIKDTPVSCNLHDNPPGAMKDTSVSCNLREDPRQPSKTEDVELNEFFDEVVHEMEEILLDSDNSPGGRFIHSYRIYQSHIPLPSRDGGSTATTSGMDGTYPLIQHLLKIEGVEVVGARQKRGDVSLSERLVGVKEYTVYKIRVWNRDIQWEVERRFRDFCTLYRRLKTIFSDQGKVLPVTWSSVEKESRKLFGSASPAIISERSVLIQECLQSILHSRFSSSPPSALIWFLSPPKTTSSFPASDSLMAQSPLATNGTQGENILSLGQTISLIVNIQPYKSVRQKLESQYYTCAGCHKHFDDGKTLILEFVQTLGWGKPRLCEYSSQLFCSSCHLNETAIIPARVLHFWDFTPYAVSQLAKSYLDSIHDKPMLCVSAVNPILSLKVPALQHVMNIRRKIVAMFPHVRCSFRRTVYQGLASRRYLIESNEFFALRDLIDLSKGVFAVLPGMVETVSRKILEHITDQCLLCCDMGVPCNARKACDNPTSLIFPFQEGEVEKCKKCKLAFHKPCFRKLASCPCGEHLNLHLHKHTEGKGSSISGTGLDGTLSLLQKKSDLRSSVGFLSGFFSKVKPGSTTESDDTVILMGSLPGTSL